MHYEKGHAKGRINSGFVHEIKAKPKWESQTTPILKNPKYNMGPVLSDYYLRNKGIRKTSLWSPSSSTYYVYENTMQVTLQSAALPYVIRSNTCKLHRVAARNK